MGDANEKLLHVCTTYDCGHQKFLRELETVISSLSRQFTPVHLLIKPNDSTLEGKPIIQRSTVHQYRIAQNEVLYAYNLTAIQHHILF